MSQFTHRSIYLAVGNSTIVPASSAWWRGPVVSTGRDLVAGSGLRFEDRGRHVLKGLPEEVQLYTAFGGV